VELGVKESEVFGCLRMIGASFGHTTLQSIRDAVGSKPDLTEEQIREWAEEHKARTGRWPHAHDGNVEAAPYKETWTAVDLALSRGHRGLTNRTSLTTLLRGDRSLTEERIIRAAQNWMKSSGKWPAQGSGWCAELRCSWARVNAALREGQRGLQGGSSISKLLEERGLVVNLQSKSRHISIDQIVTAAQDWKRNTGKRPGQLSGIDPVLGRTWGAVNLALSVGCSGLPGGSSLAKLLDEHGID